MHLSRLIACCFFGLLIFATNVQALSLGASAGRATLISSDKSNIEKLYSDLEEELYTPTWSFSFQLQYRLNNFLFGEIGLSELSYLEKRQQYNGLSADDKGERIVKFTSRESIAAVHASVGFSTFFTDEIAAYVKLGPSIHQNTYTVRQAIIQNGDEVQVREDSQINNIYDLRLYSGMGALYRVNEKYTVRVEYENFGTLGQRAQIDTFHLVGTDSRPTSGGVHVRRIMIGILYHIF